MATSKVTPPPGVHPEALPPDFNGWDKAQRVVPQVNVSALPSPVRKVLSSTGLKVQSAPAHTGAQNMPAIASVDPGSPNTINVEDPARFNQSAPQTLTHEAVHIWQNNLPPSLQAKIPPDNPNDPYNYGGTQGLLDARAKGKKMLDFPREQQSTIAQFYQSQGGDKSAPKAIRDAYKPFVDDMNEVPLSAIVPSEPDQPGINTTPRPPQGEMYSTQTFAKGDPAPGETPKHPAGDVTAFDHDTGLPIVKRSVHATRTEGKDEQEGANRLKSAQIGANTEEKPEETPANTKETTPKDETKLEKGSPVRLPDGTEGKVQYVDGRIARVRTDDGRNLTVKQSALKILPHIKVAAHVRKVAKK